ncbi:MAG TPA: M23 family metallopeptidase [Luteimonas sp.]
MRWIGMLLGGLLLGAVVYFAVLPQRGRIVAVAPTPAQAPVGQADGKATGATDATTGAHRTAPPAEDASPDVAASGRSTAAAAGPLPSGLVVPVQGIAPSSLTPTFHDDRGEGRVHEALDIMAPAGTPVLAVADGHVEKLFDSDRGGLTIYQFEPGGRYAYYYAHLERYAPGLEEGQALRRGEVIGYVGSTGNADPAAPHLHFAIFRLGPEKRWWEGTPVDPWPLLAGRAP